MDHVEEDVEEQKQEGRVDHKETQDDLDHLKKGQGHLETSMAALGSSLNAHMDTSKRRRADRWSWLKYLVFPLVLGFALKAADWLLA